MADPPVVTRLRALLTEMLTFAKGRGDDKIGRMSVILQAVTDELLEEIADSDSSPDTLERYMYWCGYMMQWAATGDLDGLPEPLKMFACRISGVTYEPPADPMPDKVIEAKVG